MNRCYRCLIVIITLLSITNRAYACEPVVPFITAVAPMLNPFGSLFILGLAVLVKCLLFAKFENKLTHTKAACLMFIGNILTSIIGFFVAMIGIAPAAFPISLLIVLVLCWMPSRRLVKIVSHTRLSRLSAFAIAGIMMVTLFISCILFIVAQGEATSDHLVQYWTIKIVAIAMSVSVMLTVIWEEWAIWRLTSRPEGTSYFPSTIRANLYTQLVVMTMLAVMILPSRLKSPNFLVKRHKVTVVAAETQNSSLATHK